MVSKKDVLGYCLAIILVALFIMLFGCPIKFFWGISCPGCGMTRACISFLKGNIAESLMYHPLVVLIPFMVILCIYTVNTKNCGEKNKLVNILWYVFGITFIIMYLVRIISSNREIVVLDINKGFFMKLFRYIGQKI